MQWSSFRLFATFWCLGKVISALPTCWSPKLVCFRLAAGTSEKQRDTEDRKVDKKMERKVERSGTHIFSTPFFPVLARFTELALGRDFSESTAWNMVHSNRISELHYIPLLFIHNHLVNKTEKKQQNKAKNRASVIARLIREA